MFGAMIAVFVFTVGGEVSQGACGELGGTHDFPLVKDIMRRGVSAQVYVDLPSPGANLHKENKIIQVFYGVARSYSYSFGLRQRPALIRLLDMGDTMFVNMPKGDCTHASAPVLMIER